MIKRIKVGYNFNPKYLGNLHRYNNLMINLAWHFSN